MENGAAVLTDPNAGAEDGLPQAKRAKVASGHVAATTAGVIRPSLLAPDSRAVLRSQFERSGPYTHLFMKDLCDDQLLRSVREEVINNIQATYKETDLFKVFQTGDLGNLDKLDAEAAAKLPSLMKLKSALYSPEFRKFVQDITGCGELTEQTDCSCNVYARGGHLLCHDDVIGTRCVSYIIYLTDPDDPWTAADGGALELYPLVAEGQPHTPDTTPTTCLLPLWNSMAMFTVQPGRSFHSVQEVVSPDKPRFSISGWYHAPTAPKGSDQASLKQLQKGSDAITTHTNFPSTTDAELSEEDLALLKRWVNPAYLTAAGWSKIQSKFEADGSVQLQNFLAKDVAQQVQQACVAADRAAGRAAGQIPGFDLGIGQGWAAVGPPHKQRYLRYQRPADAAAAAENDAAPAVAETAAAAAEGAAAKCAEAGQQLRRLQQELFESGAFARLLRQFTTLQILGHSGCVRRFRPGLDYTVAHYGILTRDPRLDCVLTFVDDTTPAAAEGWEVGEVGGFEAYLLADEEETAAAAVYRQDNDESGVINVPAACNSLNLLLRDAGLMRFVKYVSAEAPGSRWDVAMEYLPEDDGEEPPPIDEEMPPAEAAAAAGDGEDAAAAGAGSSD